jgi:uncharacterized membrane protein (DUF485 family)
MFHISIVELSFLCLIVFLVLVMPVLVAVYSRRINQRLDNLEKRIEAKKNQNAT